MLIDIALLIVSVIIIIYGIRQGFISSVLGLVAWIATIICVAKFSTPVAEWIYSDFLRDNVAEKVGSSLQDCGYGTAKSQYDIFVQSISETLNSVSNILNLNSSPDISNYNPDGYSINEVANTITDSYLSSIVIQLCKWIVSIVGFVLLMALFNYICRFIAKILRATPLKKADGLLGGIFGALKAVVIVIVISISLKMLSGVVQSNNALKSIENGTNTPKVSAFSSAVDDSYIVNKVNDTINF